jgi:type VI secretion system protein ImpA
MPFREDILNPIAGENPGGADLRYDPIYEKIKEARREEEALAQGDWKREIKVADWVLTAKLCEEAIATRSKDLQLAAWLVEAAVKQRGFAGLSEGISLLHSLVEKFWDHLYPELEDGDSEFRATPLEWVAGHMIQMSRNVALNKDGHSYFLYKESREVGYEDQVTTDAAKDARKKKIDEGRLAPELFDESFNQTPKSYYVNVDGLVLGILEKVKALGAICDEKFGDYSPSFSRLTQALEEIRQVTKSLLEKKRELEPDPIPEEGAAVAESGEGAGEPGAVAVAAGPTLNISSFTGTEVGPRKALVEALVEAAGQLRRLEPTSPGPYLMLRGLRFGELRAAAARAEMKMLEAPPTELRRQLRVYSLDGRWKDLLELTEASLGLPSSRAWMDLHRLTVEALIGLGDEFNAVAMAIRSEVRALVRDVPEIRQAVLMDDTPACNPQTQAWLDDLMDEPAQVAESAEDLDGGAAAAPAAAAKGTPLPWRKKFSDPFKVATEALRRGDKPKALEIMRNEIESQPSGRGKFTRELQVAELCVQANAKDIAQPFLAQIKSTMEEFRVAQWEDRALVVQALVDLYLYHSETVDSDYERTKVFQQICRLDPVRALGLRT